MEWNVYYHSMNCRGIKTFNVFDYYSFGKDVMKWLKKCNDKAEFEEKLKSAAMYYFWSAAQWELIIKVDDNNRIYLYPWLGSREPEKERVDVTDNTDFNWRDFAEQQIERQIYKNKAKIDVYSQLGYRWDDFVEYVWSHKKSKKRQEVTG